MRALASLVRSLSLALLNPCLFGVECAFGSACNIGAAAYRRISTQQHTIDSAK